MGNRIKSCLFGIVVILLLATCNRSSSVKPDELALWIAKPANGLIKEKTINGVNLMARFLPANHLAYREYQSSRGVPYDSILAHYKCGLSFQLTLTGAQNDPKYGNLLKYDVSSLEDYLARTRYLSFNVNEFMHLAYKNENLPPAVAHFEGYESVGNQLTFRVVFILPDFNCGSPKDSFQDITLVFDDPYWATGKSNFLFEADDIRTVPDLLL